MTTGPRPRDGQMEGSLLLEDARLVSGRTGARWRPAWQWGPETEALLRQKLADLPRPVVHVGCGSSRLGDLRLDKFYPQPDMRADARQLPFKSGSVGTVLQDPPWTGETLVERQEWVSEALRVLRVGGFYVLHAPWVVKRPTLEVLEQFNRDDTDFNMLPGPPVVLSIMRKLKDGARRG